MCHLTFSDQKTERNATIDDFLIQAKAVMDYYKKSEQKANVVHFNFMARGDAFASKYFLEHGDTVLKELGILAFENGLFPRFLISTIFPKRVSKYEIRDIFPLHHPEIYYSLYSLNNDFRNFWLPASIPVEQALEKLVNWQNHSSKIPKIHYAFIAGQNDSQEDVHSICELINEYKLRVNINIVRYNPPSEEQGIESPIEVIERNQNIFKNKLSMAQVKVIPKVGFDVYASCGMFVNQLT